MFEDCSSTQPLAPPAAVLPKGQQLTAVQTNMTGLLSNVKDTDMASAITSFSMAQTVYQASLQAGARAMQQSLLDYLK